MGTSVATRTAVILACGIVGGGSVVVVGVDAVGVPVGGDAVFAVTTGMGTTVAAAENVGVADRGSGATAVGAGGSDVGLADCTRGVEGADIGTRTAGPASNDGGASAGPLPQAVFGVSLNVKVRAAPFEMALIGNQGAVTGWLLTVRFCT